MKITFEMPSLERIRELVRTTEDLLSCLKDSVDEISKELWVINMKEDRSSCEDRPEG